MGTLRGNPLSEDSAYVKYNAPYNGAFRLNLGHSNCFFLGRYYHSTVVRLDVARDEARKLIPIDSSLMRTYIGGTYNSAVVDLYRSRSITSRFSDDPDDWLGGEPGDFTIAYYKSGHGKVEEFVIRTDNNP